MLSATPIKSSAQASHYFFEADNYYFKGEAEQNETTQWFGKGAAKLGLEGSVEREQFQALLDGQLPTGQLLGRMIDGKRQHRPGYDLTFSAPKSVSLLAIVGGDKRLDAAHDKAVNSALTAIENACAQARSINGAGDIEYENTKNLVIAKFKHDTSRDLDPQRHTHCVVLNMTEREDGKWRALASQPNQKSSEGINGFLERVFENKHYFGMIYRSQLAYEAQQLGYKIEITGEHGLFEIAGIDKTVLKHFSKRRQTIEASLEEKGFSSAKAAAAATLDTRKAKAQAVDRSELHAQWVEEASKLGVSFENLMEKSNLQSTPNEIISDLSIAKNAIHAAITHQSTFNIKINHNALVKSALHFSLGVVTPTELLNEIDTLQKAGQLLTTIEKDKTFYTTKTLLEHEQRILGSLKNAKTRQSSVNMSEANFVSVNIDSAQKPNLMRWLSNESAIKLITGHTTKDNQALIQAMVDTYERSGMTVRVLTPRGETRTLLSENIKRRPTGLWQWFMNQHKPELNQTVSKFLTIAEKESTQFLGKLAYKKHVVLVDSSEKLSINDMDRLLELQKQTGMQVVFMADEKAKSSPTATDSVALLKMANIAHIELKAGVKEKPEPLMHFAEEHQQNLRHESIARCYAQLSVQERIHSFVFAPHKKAQQLLNATIHNTLHAGQSSHSIETLIPVSMTDTERKFAKSYEIGSHIRFNTDSKKLRLSKGEYAIVIDSYPRRNTLRLKTPYGEVDWKLDNISGKEEVFKKEIRAFCVGDTVLFTRKTPELAVNNNTRANIESISDTKITLRVDKKTISISRHEPIHLDYGYVKTFYDPVITTKAHVLVDLPSQSGSSQVIYQLTQQAAEHCHIYTDNLDKLTTQLTRNESKTTGIHTVMQASGIARMINDETLSALHADIERSILLLTRSEPMLDAAATVKELTNKALNFATDKLTARNAGFTHKELLNEALAFSFGKTSIKDIEMTITEKRKNGELILGRYFNDNTRWTTQAAIDLEKNILKTMQDGIGKTMPLVSQSAYKTAMNDTHLTSGQYSAGELIATTKDRFVLIQGYAGTGKSTLLQTLKTNILDVAAGQPIILKTLAPSHRAVSELREKGLDAQTLQSFIPEYEAAIKTGKVDHSNTVFILDEASMVNNHDWFKFVTIMNESGARVVAALGDKAQLASVGSGKPFELSQRAGFPMVEMTDIVRQKTPELLSAVKSIIKGKYEDAFTELKKVDPNDHITRTEKINDSHSVVEVKDLNNENLRAQKIAEDYMTRTLDVREKTLIISHTHKGRGAINTAIQQQRLARGELNSLTSQNMPVLRSQNLTTAELQYTKHYTDDMVLRFNRDIPSVGIKKDSYWTIESNNHEHNVMSLVDRNDPKNMVIFEPERLKNVLENGLEIYKTEAITLHENELIRFTRRDKIADITANDTGIISRISEKSITVSQGDRSFTFEKDKSPLHIDLGYSTTGYGAQGMTSAYVITDEASYLKHLSNQRSFYVAVSRGQIHATIYTDNERSLLGKIKQNAGDKLSALEVTGEIDKLVPLQTVISKTKLDLQHKEYHYDAKKIDAALARQTEAVAHQLLGKPNQQLSTASNLRYGAKGSLSITLAGEKRGLWNNFETGEHGTLLTLVQKTANTSFIEALKIGAKMTGEQGDAPMFDQPKPTFKPKAPAKTNEFAQRLAKDSLPIEGTLAERYLREHRAIEHIDEGIDLRYHPGVTSKINEKILPAILAVGYDKYGKVQTVQATYLDEKTGAKASDIKVNKQTFGSPMGASISLTKQRDKAAITFITEGAETGMSIAQAMPNQDVQVTLSVSNFNHVDPSKMANTVVLCLDNDGDNSMVAKTIISAGERLVAQGKDVWIVKPDEAKTDFNDVLKKLGKSGVSEKLNTLQPFKEFRDKLTQELAIKEELSKDKKNNDTYKQFDKKNFSSDQALLKMAEHAHIKEHKTLKEFLFKSSPVDVQKAVQQPAITPSKNKGFERDR